MQLLKKKKEPVSQKASLAPNPVCYYNIHQSKAFHDFVLQLTLLKEKIQSAHQMPIFLCIGSDRATGDCFGPIVGNKLLHAFARSRKLSSLPIIYGTLSSPVHAVNLASTIEQIHTTFDNPYIIAIDASLGIRQHIGYVTFGAGPLLPGIGVQKDLPYIGNSAITGIVNLAGQNSHTTLQTTRLSTVVELASFVSNAIIEVYS